MMRTDILTSEGQRFDFTQPSTCVFGIEVIAHALSNICRFTGHTRKFYSVAQHSILVSYLVPPEHALAGLLHDAAEAFLGDVAKPLKNLLPDYQRLEQQIEAVVFGRFGLPPTLPDCVKRADLIMLASEKRDLMAHDEKPWEHELDGMQPLQFTIVPEEPLSARRSFLNRYHQILLTPGALRAQS